MVVGRTDPARKLATTIGAGPRRSGAKRRLEQPLGQLVCGGGGGAAAVEGRREAGRNGGIGGVRAWDDRAPAAIPFQRPDHTEAEAETPAAAVGVGAAAVQQAAAGRRPAARRVRLVREVDWWRIEDHLLATEQPKVGGDGRVVHQLSRIAVAALGDPPESNEPGHVE
eukprot:SAG22_NODE_856_length_6839_cov_3.284570_8_plen_168_part_00